MKFKMADLAGPQKIKVDKERRDTPATHRNPKKSQKTMTESPEKAEN